MKREANPGWIKVRSDVYDAVKARRDEELSAKNPVEISVTLPDGKTLSEDKVSNIPPVTVASHRETVADL